MRNFNSKLAITKASEVISIGLICYTSISILELLVRYG